MTPAAPLVDAWAPCTPVPCSRPRFDSVRRRTYTDTRSEQAARTQASLLASQGPRGTLTGPVFVTLHYTMPTKQKGRHGRPHTIRPDVDNLAKLTMDAISRLGWWVDDCQVCSLVAVKKWGESGGVRVIVRDDL